MCVCGRGKPVPTLLILAAVVRPVLGEGFPSESPAVPIFPSSNVLAGRGPELTFCSSALVFLTLFCTERMLSHSSPGMRSGVWGGTGVGSPSPSHSLEKCVCVCVGDGGPSSFGL